MTSHEMYEPTSSTYTPESPKYDESLSSGIVSDSKPVMHQTYKGNGLDCTQPVFKKKRVYGDEYATLKRLKKNMNETMVTVTDGTSFKDADLFIPTETYENVELTQQKQQLLINKQRSIFMAKPNLTERNYTTLKINLVDASVYCLKCYCIGLCTKTCCIFEK